MPQTDDSFLKILKDLDNYHKSFLYKQPNTTSLWSDEDTEGNYVQGGRGKWRMTNHLNQERDWEKISYSYNDDGLRGPKPDVNAKKKIIFAGNCVFFGHGVYVEDSFPHIYSKKIGASYINISESRIFTDMIEDIDRISKWFKPDKIVFSSCRFFDASSFIELHMRLRFNKLFYKDKEQRSLIRNELRGRIKKSHFTHMTYIFEYLKNKYKCPIVYIHQKDFNPFTYEGINIININEDLMVDLGRDNKHPGPQSHNLIANEIYKLQPE